MPAVGSYLQRSRHQTTFYFRRRVPRDLWEPAGQQQLYFSLATGDRRLAIRRARLVAALSDDWMQQLQESMSKRTPKPRKFRTHLSIQWAPDGSVKFQTDPHDTPEIVAAAQPLLREALAKASTPGAGAAAPHAPVIDLGTLVSEFLANIKNSKTFRVYRTALQDHFLEHFGKETDIQDVDQDAFAAWVEKVFADETRSHATKEGYVNAVLSMFSSRAKKHSKTTPTLSASRLIPPKVVAESEERDGFELADLTALFRHAARYRVKEPHKFWVTVWVAFTGCRLEELAQLDLRSDLKQAPSGIWYADLNENPDHDGVRRKGLKRVNTSRRVVPIHSALVRHGLVDYLHRQVGFGTSRPFERGWRPWIEPDRGESMYSHYIARWGSDELKRIVRAGVLPQARKFSYFHSLRHAQATHYARRGVPEEQRPHSTDRACPGSARTASAT